MSVFFLNRLGHQPDQPVTRRFVIAAILQHDMSTPTGGPANMRVRDTHDDEHLLTADEFSPETWRSISVGTILEVQVMEQVRVWSGPRLVET